MENLFSYGTLQLPPVQLANFGRLLHGEADTLTGYKLSFIQIEDDAVLASSGMPEHPIIICTNNDSDLIDGIVFEVTAAELLKADEYEVADYKRIKVVLKSGKPAWVYVSI